MQVGEKKTPQTATCTWVRPKHRPPRGTVPCAAENRGKQAGIWQMWDCEPLEWWTGARWQVWEANVGTAAEPERGIEQPNSRQVNDFMVGTERSGADPVNS